MSPKKLNPFKDFQSDQIQRSSRKIFTAHYACRNAALNFTPVTGTTNGFIFQIINSLIESWGVRLTWFDCKIYIWLLALADRSKKMFFSTLNLTSSYLVLFFPPLVPGMNFNNQNYLVYLYAIFVSNHRQSNSKLHHAAAEMNKVDVLYSIGMKTSSNFVVTAINNIIWRGLVNMKN